MICCSAVDLPLASSFSLFVDLVEWERGDTSPYAVALSPLDTQNLRELTIQEVEQATYNFSQNNIIGEGRFGLAYKGLLQDGSIVAIKRRLHAPTRSFFHQVNLRNYLE